MNPIFACTRQPADWQPLLARPDRHWRTGFSARALANAWQNASGFPPEVGTALRGAGPELAAAEPMLAVPEYVVELPGGRQGSHNDILVLGRAAGGAFAMAVEGKVSETFGQLLGDWLRAASPGKRHRWRFLRKTLGIGRRPVPKDLRYQLFHRAASAVLLAQRHHAKLAIMLVHSFSPEEAGFADYRKFVDLFGVTGERNRTALLAKLGEVELYAAWVSGDRRFLVS